MAAISVYLHEQFIKHFENNIRSAGEEDKLQLEEDVLELERLYVDYKERIVEIRELIEKYTLLQRQIRINLRKQQLLHIAQRKY